MDRMCDGFCWPISRQIIEIGSCLLRISDLIMFVMLCFHIGNEFSFPETSGDERAVSANLFFHEGQDGESHTLGSLGVL